MTFTTVKEVEAALERLMAVAHETTAKNITTERTFELAQLVGNPQQRLKIIHIAGTSGKTSTSYYIARLLHAAGVRTGLTVSPHIASITERVQIDGSPMSDADFCQYMSEFLPMVTTDEKNLPSYFEVMMVFALWIFDKLGVDYAVVETGLGGLHDSSNICRRADKICVITDIGIDHTHVLGNTIEEIAVQKAGIIAFGNDVIMHRQGEPVMEVFRRYAEQQNAKITEIMPVEYVAYQDRNFSLARAAYDLTAKRDGLIAIDPEVAAEIRRTTVPGRFETVLRRGAKILRDGAHNEQKMQALVRTLESEYPGQKWAVVLAMKDSKDYEAVIRQLAPMVVRAIVTQLHGSQDTPTRSVDPGILMNEFHKYNVTCIERPTIATAIDQLIDDHETHILVTGSLYALHEVA